MRSTMIFSFLNRTSKCITNPYPRASVARSQIVLPVWGPQTGTETRLVCDHDAMRVYDNQKYEGQMFHFNTVTRSQIYAHGVIEMAEGLDHCFDCRSEVHVLEGYMRMAARRARAIGLNLYPPAEVYRFASPATASAFGAGEDGAAAMAAAAASQQVPPLTWDAVWALMPAVLEAKAENVMHRIAEFSFDISRELSSKTNLARLSNSEKHSQQ